MVRAWLPLDIDSCKEPNSNIYLQCLGHVLKLFPSLLLHLSRIQLLSLHFTCSLHVWMFLVDFFFCFLRVRLCFVQCLQIPDGFISAFSPRPHLPLSSWASRSHTLPRCATRGTWLKYDMKKKASRESQSASNVVSRGFQNTEAEARGYVARHRPDPSSSSWHLCRSTLGWAMGRPSHASRVSSQTGDQSPDPSEGCQANPSQDGTRGVTVE